MRKKLTAQLRVFQNYFIRILINMHFTQTDFRVLVCNHLLFRTFPLYYTTMHSDLHSLTWKIIVLWEIYI